MEFELKSNSQWVQYVPKLILWLLQFQNVQLGQISLEVGKICTASLTCGVRATIVGRSSGSHLALPLPGEDAEVTVPTTPPFNSYLASTEDRRIVENDSLTTANLSSDSKCSCCTSCAPPSTMCSYQSSKCLFLNSCP